jgi:hypothetical protein
VTPADLPDDALLEEYLRRAPSALVPADFAVRALAAARRNPTQITAPAGGMWKAADLEALHTRIGRARSRSAVIGDIAAGLFGTPNTDGGPRRTSRGWLVPHAAVLAHFAGEAPPLTFTPKPAGRQRPPVRVLSIADRREARKAEKRPAAVGGASGFGGAPTGGNGTPRRFDSAASPSRRTSNHETRGAPA